ncbi:GH3 auxin-responsive promoter family protein [Streptomyces sp. NPDC058486]|uniref:GH3 family domain-containing protein n=1 Tax=unclassified Streptomyces TaxID=2593676 RepID=UPI00365D8B71
MTAATDAPARSGWHSPGHADRYRARVFAARAGLTADHADPRGAQERVLADLLEFNAETAFGREHGFGGLRTVDDFRRAVPVGDYASHAALIERTAAGERGLLTADAPELYFTSSGSTGAHKKIPVTPRFMRTTFMPFYFAAWAPLAEHFPEVLERPDAVLNLKHDPPAAPPVTGDGRPHVGASQVDLGARFGEPLAAEPGTGAPWAVLPVATDPADHLERAYLRLRLAVQSDVRCVIGINPAMVAAVPYQLNLWWPRIVREVRDGTLGGVPYGAPDPRRAAELERLAAYFGTVRPAHVWPRMRVLFCWSSGVASLYLPALREEFGAGVTVLPAPVAASEGPVAVALDRHASAGSLVASASLYEFVPAERDLGPGAETLLAHEVEAGRDYHVLFSHVGGLYRYAGGDVVRVVDRAGGLPRLEYAGRAGRLDAAGERLRDAEVVRAVRAALESGGLGLRNVSCRAEPGPGGVPRHVFAVAPTTPWSTTETERFGEALDRSLAAASAPYAHARSAGRLAAPAVRLLDADAFARAWSDTVASGVRPAQAKDRLFETDGTRWTRLTGAPAV